MGVEDVACIRALPNIGIIQPGDELETKQVIATRSSTRVHSI